MNYTGFPSLWRYNSPVSKAFFLIFFLLYLVQANAARVDTVEVQSLSMHRSVFNVVITPQAYSKNKKPCAVLYLLHGAGGTYRDWITNVGALKEYCDRYGFLIVCPDGGRTSWYFDSPVDTSMRYETYVAGELVDFIDQKYNTIRKPAGRAITGLSMGGHGALYLAFRHPDIFGAAGSMSGGVDFRPFPKNWDIAKRLGEYTDQPGNWERNTVTNMIDSVKGKSFALIIDCGVDDFFYTVNKRFHEKLLEAKVPHDYIERPGKHNWMYWGNAIEYQLLFFRNFFRK